MNSIQGRLTAIAFFFIICTSVAMGIVGFRLTVNFERARLSEHFSLLASYLASNAELGVMLGNEKILTDLAENMLAITNVQRVIISAKNGQTLVDKRQENVQTVAKFVSAEVFASSMGQVDSPFLLPVVEKELLGKVVIFFSNDGIAELKQKLAFRFLLVSLALAFASVLMYLLLSKAIISPLHALLRVARQVSKGEMSVRAKGSGLLEINTLSVAFNDMLDTLELQRQQLSDTSVAMAKHQALAEVGKFSMIVAHEIKNPLTIIKGSLDVLKKEETKDAQLKNKLMLFIDEEVSRINKLVEDFLLFARPREPTFLAMPLRDLLISLTGRLQLMRADLDIAFPHNTAAKNISCDSQLFERAFLNIVRNAMEVSGETSSVKIRGYLSHRLFVLTVRDRGPGIAKKDQHRIFEPFYSTKAKGTGLGLAIVKEIIEAHTGKISVTNRKTGGACFIVSLPLDCIDQG